jgi:RHS repeat-associated protein
MSAGVYSSTAKRESVRRRRHRGRVCVVVGITLSLIASGGVAAAQLPKPDPAAAHLPKPKHVARRAPLPAMKGPASARGGVARAKQLHGPTVAKARNPLAHPTKLIASTAQAASLLSVSSGQPVEVTEERTTQSSTLSNPDGTTTLLSYSSPVRVRTGNSWADIDYTLTSDGLAVYPVASDTAVRFSAGGNSQLASLGTGDGTITVNWVRSLPAPTLSGPTATYANVEPGIDLTVTDGSGGFDIGLVVKERPTHPLVFSLPIQARDLSVKRDSAGDLAFANRSGDVTVDSSTPSMSDSAIDPHSGEPTHTATVPSQIEMRGATGAVLTVRPPASFFSNPAVTYPVVIDPNTVLTRTAYDFTESQYPTTTHWNNTTSDVQNGHTYTGITKTGTFDSGSDKFNAYYIFPTSAISGKHVTATSMKFHEYWSYSCTKESVSLYSTSAAFSSTLDYANQPNTSTLLGSATVAYGWSPTSCAENDVSFTSSAMTSYAQTIATNHTTSSYVTLRAGSYTSDLYWKKFLGSGATFSVTYESYPGTPTSPSPANAATIGSLTPTLSASVSDPDAGVAVHGQFVLLDQTAGTTITSGSNGSTFTTTSTTKSGTSSYKTPTLTNLHTYQWKVRSVTSSGLTSAYIPSSGYYTFTIKQGGPPSAPVNVTAQPGDSQVQVSWSPPADDGGTGITSYTVYQYTSSDPATCPATPSASGASKTYTGITTTSYTVSSPNVTNGNSYCFAVAAINGSNFTSPLAGTGLASVQPHGPVTVAKVASDAGVPQPIYDAGQAPTFTVTFTNPETVGTMHGLQLSDDIPGVIGANLDANDIMVGGTAVTSPGTCAVVIGCSLNNSVDPYHLEFDQDIPAGKTVTLTYAVELPASGGLGCAQFTNTASTAWPDGVLSPTSTTPLTLTACSSYLGLESWWSTVNTPVGPDSDAHVNVADGNLVVTATDGLPVQAHGRLGLIVRRTYNSQENTIATLPGALGTGWRLNVGQTDAIATDALSPDALYVPSFESIEHPFDVTMIDRDGTRHVFSPSGIVASATVPGLAPLALPSAETGYSVCADESFSAPPGVHLALWRYIETTATCGGSLTNANSKLIGFAAERPDRIRYEYAADGHLVAMFDGAGNQLRYLYGASPVSASVPAPVDTTHLPIPSLGSLQAVLPANNSACLVSGAVPTTLSSVPAACPALRFYYFSGETDVYGPSTYPGDTRSLGPTRYYTTGSLQTAQLTDVVASDDPANVAANAAAGYGVAAPMALTTTSGLPDRTHYTYCGTVVQLCGIDVTKRGSTGHDNADETTGFTYRSPSTPFPGISTPPAIASMTDRRGTVTNFGYDNPDAPTVTTATRSTEVATYSQIDDAGRVARLDEGTSSTALHTTLYAWDGATNTTNPYTAPAATFSVGSCEQPDGALDNNLCRVQRLALAPDTANDPGATQQPDSETSYTYGDAGDLLGSHQCVSEHAVTSSAVTGAQGTSYTAGWADSCPAGGSSPYVDVTHGVHMQYFGAFATPVAGSTNWTDGTSLTTNDTPDGNGGVTSGTRPQPGDVTLYTISDPIVDLPARGNATGSLAAAAPYESHSTVDYPADGTAPYPAPNRGTQSAVCGSTAGTPTGATTGNTGLVCETDTPSYHGSTTPDTTTRYTYDQFGQRSAMLTPNQVAGIDASCPESATPATPHPGSSPYRYTYYADSDTDAETSIATSNAISAGGWLKAVTDPCGKSVVFQYDRAGHVIDTWDRTAVGSHALTEWTGSTSPAGLPNAADSYRPNAGSPASATSATSPWRYRTASSDALGNMTTVTTDLAGHPLSVTSPAGKTTTSDYDTSGELVTRTLPAEAASGASTTLTYDAFGNLATSTDPRGNVTALRYDAVNRLYRRYFTRSASDSNHPTPVGCDVTSGTPSGGSYPDANSDPSSLPSGRVACYAQSAYDGVDRGTGSRDPSGVTSHTTYDGLGRPLTSLRPRDASTTLVATSVYDADGHVLLSCPPRQQSEGGANSCTTTAANATGAFCAGTVSAPAQYSTLMEYDYAGRLCHRQTYREHDASANASLDVLNTSAGYDPDGNPTSTTDARGKTATATFDALDQRVTSTAPRSGTTTYQYDAVGDRTAVIEPGSAGDNVGSAGQGTSVRITAYTYDADHRLADTVKALQVASIDPPDDPTAVNAAANPATGAPSSAAAQTNLRSRVTYDLDGNVVTSADPRAFVGSASTADGKFVTRITYDSDQRRTAVFTPRYDTASVTDPNGDSTQASQCATGASGYASSTGVCVTRYAYYADGNLKTQTMPTSASTDPNSPSDNRYVQYTYTDDNLTDTVSSPSPVTAGARVTTRAVYDGDGRQTQSVNALSQTTTTTYNYDGTVAETRDADGPSGLSHITDLTYNAAGQVTSTVAPRTVTCTSGGTSSTITERAATTTTYYVDGLAKAITSPAAAGSDPANTCTYTTNTRTYSYDANGNVATSADPNAVAKQAGSNPRGIPTSYSYTDDNLVATLTQPTIVGTAVDGSGDQNRVTTYTYDTASRKVSEQADLTGVGATTGGKISYTYYPDDQLKTKLGRGAAGASDANTHVDYTYDAAGQALTISDTQPPASSLGGTTGSTVTNTLSAQYYLDGLLRNVTATFGAQHAGTQTSSTSQYSYDAAGVLTQRNVDGATTSATANDAELVTAVNDSRLDAPSTSIGLTYNSIGQLLTRTDANGDKLTNTYNASTDDTLASSVVTNAAGTTLASDTYTYDERYRVRQQSFFGTGGDQLPIGSAASPITYTYDYDPGARLSGFTDPAGLRTITYDPSGNRTNYGVTGQTNPQQWTYRADNSIATATSHGTTQTYTYSASFGGLGSDGCNTYTYDGFDDLQQVVGQTATGCAPASTASYSTDGLGRQAQVTQRGATGTVVSDTAESYDGMSSSIANEHDYTASTDVAYVLDAAGNPLFAKKSGVVATNNYLLDDGTNSVGTITGAAGLVACTARYDGYGGPDGNTSAFATNPTGSCNSGSAISDVFYRMNRKDSSTGNYQDGARTYDPGKGSFLTPDSMSGATAASALAVGVDPLTQNRYSYVNGDPVNFDDPTGHRTDVMADGGGGGSPPCDQACRVSLIHARDTGWDQPYYEEPPAATTPPKKHKHCSWYNAICQTEHAASDVADVAGSVTHDVSSLAVSTYDAASDTFSSAVSLASSGIRDATSTLDDLGNRFVHGVKTLASDTASLGSTVVHGVTSAVRTTVRGIATAAKVTTHAVVGAVKYCLGRGASTCAAAAGAVALAATGVGLVADAGIVAEIGATALGASRALSVVAFATTGDPTQLLGALPGVGALEEGAAAARTVEETTQSLKAVSEAEVGDHIVLGKSIGLEERAAKIGGRHLLNDPEWQATLTRGIADPSTKISVALDDVEGASTYGRVMSAVQRSAAGRGTGFDWEMRQLHDGGQLGNVDFWEGGVRIANPF